MTDEIVVTLKGEYPSDPWLVVHAAPESIEKALEFVSGDLLARVHGMSAIFQASKNVASIAPPATTQPTQAEADGPPPWESQQTPTPQQPVAPATPSPSPDAGATGLPPGVTIWTAPDAKKPQYQATWFTLPFPNDKAAGDAFRNELKKVTWAKWNGEQGDNSAWYANTKHEAWIRNHFITNGHLFT